MASAKVSKRGKSKKIQISEFGSSPAYNYTEFGSFGSKFPQMLDWMMRNGPCAIFGVFASAAPANIWNARRKGFEPRRAEKTALFFEKIIF